MSEAAVQNAVRLEYARRGAMLHRNNSGSLPDPDSGRWIRFGLGNDSEQTNRLYKSSDLIGWMPILITPAHVGQTLAVFTSVECKPPGWRLTPADKRGQAQQRWLDLVRRDGGIGLFATGIGDIPA